MSNQRALSITSLEVKNFRCFTHKIIAFEKPIVLLQGLNGKGKTSLLEALYYAAYLRSFKNALPKDITHFGKDSFFIKIGLAETRDHESLARTLQVGFADQTKLVKIDQQKITSYKELLHHYRVVCVTEDDLELVQEGPKVRRFFLDQLLTMLEPSSISHFKELRAVTDQRNSYLIQQRGDKQEYAVWTEQLWNISATIQHERSALLVRLENTVNQLLSNFFEQGTQVSLVYQPKKDLLASSHDFVTHHTTLYDLERRYGRSLFGAHLDDFSILFEQKKSRVFLSRGQQKLVTVLLKIAHATLLQEVSGSGVVFLLDDFMTDFDAVRTEILLRILRQTGAQLIITSPLQETGVQRYLSPDDLQTIYIE